MTESRGAYRKPTFLAAFAQASRSGEATPCLLRDLSRTGARVVCTSGPLPDDFKIEIGGRVPVRHARVVWRRGTHLGVVFIAPPDAVLPPNAVPPTAGA